ncbi:MAG: hypothetical protein ABF876_17875 [Acetobacter aceti]
MRNTFALMLGLALAATPACAQHLPPDALDHLSAERQAEIGHRNWGPPVNPPAQAQTLSPLPVPATCKSPATDFEPLYAAPARTARQVGVAAPQIAVTDATRDGWTQVELTGRTLAWIPSRDVVAYRPLVADHPTGCTVAGQRANGMIAFSHPDR